MRDQASPHWAAQFVCMQVTTGASAVCPAGYWLAHVSMQARSWQLADTAQVSIAWQSAFA